MFTVLILLMLFIVVDLAALRWGVDSTDTFDSCEWERRRCWQNDVNDRLLVR